MTRDEKHVRSRIRRGLAPEPGQRAFLDLRASGPVPTLRDGEPVEVIAVHPHDDLYDYEWCSVRLGDGREVDLPTMLILWLGRG